MDLAHIDLRDGHFRGARFGDASLVGAKLDGADLSETDLAGARLDGASLPGGGGLRRASLVGATVVGATFVAELGSGHWVGVDLTNADLTGARFEWFGRGSNVWTDVSLRGAVLRSASLPGAQMDRVDLGGAQLDGANLRRVAISELRAVGASFDAAQCSQMVINAPADLRDATFRRADLSDAVFDPGTQMPTPDAFADADVASTTFPPGFYV